MLKKGRGSFFQKHPLVASQGNNNWIENLVGMQTQHTLPHLYTF